MEEVCQFGRIVAVGRLLSADSKLVLLLISRPKMALAGEVEETRGVFTFEACNAERRFPDFPEDCMLDDDFEFNPSFYDNDCNCAQCLSTGHISISSTSSCRDESIAEPRFQDFEGRDTFRIRMPPSSSLFEDSPLSGYFADAETSFLNGSPVAPGPAEFRDQDFSSEDREFSSEDLHGTPVLDMALYTIDE